MQVVFCQDEMIFLTIIRTSKTTIFGTEGEIIWYLFTMTEWTGGVDPYKSDE